MFDHYPDVHVYIFKNSYKLTSVHNSNSELAKCLIIPMYMYIF